MSPTSPRESDVAGARLALVTAARRDLGAAMALAVPFVLAHPTEASVLVELAAIADRSASDVARFRKGLGLLLRVALRSEGAQKAA